MQTRFFLLSTTGALAVSLLALPAAGQDSRPVSPDTQSETGEGETHRTEPDREVIIVQASRTGTALGETPGAVSVITAADIAARANPALVDAIAAVPGVTLNRNGAFGGVASLRIRGAASEQTLVLIDGVVVNDPSSPGGGFDAATLDGSEAARVEVLRGPQSVLWGSNAMGGVVNIVTPRAEEPGSQVHAFAEAGGLGQARTGARFAVTGTRADGHIAAVRARANGISAAEAGLEDDGFERTNLTARGAVTLRPDARLSASLRYADAEADIDGFPAPDFVLADTGETSQSEETSGAVTLDLGQADARWRHTLQLSASRIDRAVSDPSFPFAAEGARDAVRAQTTFEPNTGWRLTGGFDAEETRSDTGTSETKAAGQALFGLADGQLSDTVRVSGGLRFDEIDDFGSETTGGLGALWQAREGVRLSAQWGRAFRAPSLFQRDAAFFPATAPNADLRAETSESLEVGATFDLPRSTLQLTAFTQRFEDQIVFLSGRFENQAQSDVRGLEASLTAALSDAVSLRAAYTYLDTEVGPQDARAIRLPTHAGDVALTWQVRASTQLSAFVRYNGEEREPNFTPGVTTPVEAWTRVDLAGETRLSDAVSLYARIENLFDADYQEVAGYGTPGVTGLVGVRVRS